MSRHGNKANPLDEVIYILLSSQTDEKKFQQAYTDLKRRFHSWKRLSRNDIRAISAIIEPAGLSKVKSENIVTLFEMIENNFGVRSLAQLKKMPDDVVENYLCSLPGIGKKSARCVMMYSLNRQVFPLDTHCFRILKRLGAHDYPHPIRRWHDRIQEIVPKDIRYALHVTLLSLGRDLCRSLTTNCGKCPLKEICCHYEENKKS
ncbi:MAG: hypothetical protein GYA70_03830 [Deltaproteobacteria bacterium]|nr:hypothetical protein [Deltaproteobacteria bacterium]